MGEVFELLFADRHFTENVRKEVNNRSWVFTKKEILNCLEEIQEDTLWERLFSKDSESDLHNNFYQVKKYRNDIMHAHEMDTKSFRFAQKLIENINKELDKEIGKLLDKNNIPQNNISEHNFNKMISDVAKEAENAKQIARDSILDLVTKIIKNGINDEYSNNVAPEQQE